jgi:hypothetical protein
MAGSSPAMTTHGFIGRDDAESLGTNPKQKAGPKAGFRLSLFNGR